MEIVISSYHIFFVHVNIDTHMFYYNIDLCVCVRMCVNIFYGSFVRVFMAINWQKTWQYNRKCVCD